MKKSDAIDGPDSHQTYVDPRSLWNVKGSQELLPEMKQPLSTPRETARDRPQHPSPTNSTSNTLSTLRKTRNSLHTIPAIRMTANHLENDLVSSVFRSPTLFRLHDMTHAPTKLGGVGLILSSPSESRSKSEQFVQVRKNPVGEEGSIDP
ncbi:MAG TPA: hypothetical protein DGU45_09075 [Planctomycetes bacterium]|nr:hypothetical protein [Planctomycetota bacterium]